MAFHAFHTLSFPWPALEVKIKRFGNHNAKVGAPVGTIDFQLPTNRPRLLKTDYNSPG
jgi:hypothetical protein